MSGGQERQSLLSSPVSDLQIKCMQAGALGFNPSFFPAFRLLPPVWLPASDPPAF